METDINNLPTLAELESLSPSELRTLYSRLVLAKAPCKASMDFLRGNIAWMIQARQSGQAPDKLRAEMLKQVQRTALPSSKSPHHKPGTRMIREWQGQTYEVTRLDKGYLFQDRRWRSLSQIAQVITGSHWSGPRFFGLTG